MVSLYHYLILASILFCLGATGLLIRRNIITILMSMELMLNGANIVFVAFSKFNGNMDGQVISIFIMAIAACEAAVGLAILVSLFRKTGELNIDYYNSLKG